MIRGLRNIERRVLPHGSARPGAAAAALRRRLLRLPARARHGRRQGRRRPPGTRRRSSTSSTACNMFVEPSVQAWASSQRWLIHAADWMYINSHFVVTSARSSTSTCSATTRFYFVRNMFLIAMGIALVGYVALPDRAAAVHAGVGLHRLGRRLHRRARRGRARSTRCSTRTPRCRRCTSASR